MSDFEVVRDALNRYFPFCATREDAERLNADTKRPLDALDRIEAEVRTWELAGKAHVAQKAELTADLTRLRAVAEAAKGPAHSCRVALREGFPRCPERYGDTPDARKRRWCGACLLADALSALEEK